MTNSLTINVKPQQSMEGGTEEKLEQQEKLIFAQQKLNKFSDAFQDSSLQRI